MHPQDLEMSRIDLTKSKTILSPSEVQKDIKYLLYALDNAYAGKLVHPEIYTSLILELQTFATATNEDIPTDQFFASISKALNKFPDGHLAIYPYVEMNSESEEKPVERSLSSVPEFPTGMHKIKGKNVFVSKIPSFLIDPANEGKDIVIALEDNLQKAEAIIFDLRGNSGGYVSLPLQLAALLWGEQYRDQATIQYFPMPIQKTGSLRNPVIFALAKNSAMLLKTEFGKRLNEQASKGFFESLFSYNEYEYGGTVKKIIYDEYAFAPTSDEEENTLTYENLYLKKKGYNRPIFLLVDSSCASSCERFVEALESHPYAKTIGQRTRGVVQYGSIFSLVMPESHFVAQIPTAYVTYKDKRAVEKNGYKPMITLDNNENSFNKAVQLIK